MCEQLLCMCQLVVMSTTWLIGAGKRAQARMRKLFPLISSSTTSSDVRSSQVHDWGALLAMPNGTRHVLHVSEVAHGKVWGGS